jgi:hypothetical protein
MLTSLSASKMSIKPQLGKTDPWLETVAKLLGFEICPFSGIYEYYVSELLYQTTCLSSLVSCVICFF